VEPLELRRLLPNEVDVQTLRQSLKYRLAAMFNGQLPPAGFQPHGTALAMALAHDLGGVPGNPARFLSGAPHDAATRKLLSRHGVDYRHREWLLDFVVFEPHGMLVEIPVLACESEVHPAHGVEYSFDCWPDSNSPKNGFVWDFRKLLFVAAPQLLFIARVNKEQGDGKFSRLLRLKKTITACALDYAAAWSGRTLRAVLLPNGATEGDWALLGVSGEGGAVHWEWLNHPLEPVP
jgi:hypothetical protein